MLSRATVRSRMAACVLATLESLAARLQGRCVTLIIGHGSKNCFADVHLLRRVLSESVRGQTLLYFGDTPNPGKPDIGLAFKIYAELNPDASIYMVQIDEARPWGTPDFVDCVFWHLDFLEGPFKWGGVDGADPQSNTKVWFDLFTKFHIEMKAYVLGGGPIARQEHALIERLRIPCVFIPMQRLYAGDGATLAKDAVAA